MRDLDFSWLIRWTVGSCIAAFSICIEKCCIIDKMDVETIDRMMDSYEKY